MPEATIGRHVLFHRSGYEGVCLDAKQPMAAIITFVHGPGSVNLAVFGHKGETFPMDGVELRAADSDKAPGSAAYCEWPPQA